MSSCLTIFLVVLSFTLAIVPGTHATGCSSKCTETWGRCAGKGMEASTCCDPNVPCVKKGPFYSQCRPTYRTVPDTWSGEVLTCSDAPASPPVVTTPPPPTTPVDTPPAPTTPVDTPPAPSTPGATPPAPPAPSGLSSKCEDLECATGRVCDEEGSCVAIQTGAAGDACNRLEAGCGEGLTCDFFLRIPACKESPVTPEGGRCGQRFPDCDEGLFCEGVCRKRIPLGAPCSQQLCEEGAHCENGRCAADVITQFGESCNLRGRRCDETLNLVCDEDGEQFTTCVEFNYVQAGEACDQDDGDGNRSGPLIRRCKGDTQCFDDVCKPLIIAGEGEECFFEGPVCGLGLQCGQGETCEKLRPKALGQSCDDPLDRCSGTNVCYSQGVEQQTCQAVNTSTAGGPCGTSIQRCDIKTKCVGNVCATITFGSVGEPCNSDEKLCDGNLSCLNDSCLLYQIVGPGEPCNSEDRVCEQGVTTCQGEQPTCQIINTVSVGEACGDVTRVCTDEATCGTDDDGATFTCRLPIASGQGDFCKNTAEYVCAEGTSCTRTGVCLDRTFSGPGLDCSKYENDSETCAEGFFCRDSPESKFTGKCVEIKSRPEGGVCELGTEQQCGDGLECLSEGVCVKSAQLGELCSRRGGDRPKCGDGLVCLFLVGSLDEQCVAEVAGGEGESCDDGFGVNGCAQGLLCDRNTRMCTSQVPLKKGELCSPIEDRNTGLCGVGLTCRRSAGRTFKCQEPVATGGICTQRLQCGSLAVCDFTGNTCQPRFLI